MNSYYKIMAIIGLFMVSGCSQSPETTACKQLDEIDLEMLNIIKQIEQEYQQDEEFMLALKDAQLFWTQYRNRQVKAVFTKSPKNYDYLVGECKCEIYRDLTALRVKELQKWLDGVSPEVTCKGSYKVTN